MQEPPYHKSMELTERHPNRPGFRPLYQQVRELFLSRISSGAWRPAESLPSEQSLAAELGVSQGTVRKALDSLAADNLVERRQGKGTFVSQHTQESAKFRFFKLYHSTGEHALPMCKDAKAKRRRATANERAILNLASRADVFSIERTRFINDKPTLRELIAVPAALFPNLDLHQPIPNTLYTLYQSEYGVSIVGAIEKLRAVEANKEDARALKKSPGAPVLEVERIALDLDNRPVELRLSRFCTEGMHYLVELK